MTKVTPAKPILIYLYGFPGSGKSYAARHLNEVLQIAHVSADRIRNELFEHPRYDNQENAIITHLMSYMTEEFLNAGVSVVYDVNAARIAQRRNLRSLAARHKASHLLVWFQIDMETAYHRTQQRDRRTSDDKYAEPQTRLTFDKQVAAMQNPQAEEYLVISGKHTFATQKSAIINRLYQIGLIGSDAMQHHIAAPGLINLIPNPQSGRVDLSRRNITIH